MHKILASLLMILTLCGASLFGISKAHALTISPSRVEISGNPGDTLENKFLIANEQGDTKTFYTNFENFEASGETGTPSFKPGVDDLASWIKAPAEITLTKGEQQKVPFSIVIPADAEPGGHFAAIFLSTVPPQATGGEVAVGAKIGILILLRVNGDVKEGGGILNFNTADGKKVYSSLPVDFAYRFQNSGNDRVNPQGEVKIKNLFRMTSDILPANKGEGNVLPGSTRKFKVTWGDESAEKAETSRSFFGTINHQLHNFALGPYTAHLLLHYGGTNQAEASYTVFVFPWQLLLVVLILLLIIIFFLRGGIKRYNRWIISKARSA